MIERLAIFGATGDLTVRYLLPGLAALQAAGQLGDRFQLASAGREEWDTDGFRQGAAAQLDRHGGQFPAAARQAVVSASSCHQADVAEITSVADVIVGDGPVAAYLALPPAVFPVAVSALHAAGLPPGSRIVLETRFGEDLDSAVELNRLLAELVPEPAVFSPGRIPRTACWASGAEVGDESQPTAAGLSRLRIMEYGKELDRSRETVMKSKAAIRVECQPSSVSGVRRHQPTLPQRSRQQPRQGGEHRPVGPFQPRAMVLAPRYRDLLAQHQQRHPPVTRVDIK